MKLTIYLILFSLIFLVVYPLNLRMTTNTHTATKLQKVKMTENLLNNYEKFQYKLEQLESK